MSAAFDIGDTDGPRLGPGPVSCEGQHRSGCHYCLMPRVIHHEIVIRWDTVTEDPTSDVVPDSTLAYTWRTIVEQHLKLGPEAPTLQVTARSWVDGGASGR
jgi:hypothetical protein